MDPDEQEQIAAELRVRVTEKYLSEDRVISVRTLDVHPGPQKWKTVSLLVIGDVESGEVKKQELRVQTWARKPLGEGAGYDFEKDEYHWHCEGEAEIDAVRRFLNGEFEAEGRYVLIREESDVTTVLEAMGAGGIDAETLGNSSSLRVKTQTRLQPWQRRPVPSWSRRPSSSSGDDRISPSSSGSSRTRTAPRETTSIPSCERWAGSSEGGTSERHDARNS